MNSKTLLIVLIVLLVVAIGGGGYLYLKMSKSAAGSSSRVPLTEEQVAANMQAQYKANLSTAKFLKLNEFTTETPDQFSWTKVTVQMALKDEAAVTLAKGMQPEIERTCLYEIRQLNGKRLQGADGMKLLEDTLEKQVRALDPKLNEALYKLIVTQLAVQQ